MTQRIRRIIKAVTPPIVLNQSKAIFISKGGKRIFQEVKSEKDAIWYDKSFDKSNIWKKHYSLSDYYFLWTVIADRIARSGNKSILEIGCGSGQLACLLRDKGVKNYHGFDFSFKRIEQAKKICPEFDFSQQDALKTDLFTTYDYNATVATEFLEHVEGDIDVLNRIRSGTTFYGSVPNFPFTSHVRYFNNESEVIIRYKRCFQSLSVDSFLANERGSILYLIEGKIA